MLCGFICGGAPAPERAWLDQLLPRAPHESEGQPEGQAENQPAPDDAPAEVDPRVQEARADLSTLARHTLERIAGPGLGFALLLPDDARPLAQRATGLYDWVRGFLFAVGILGLNERDLSAQAREVLRDFANITRMDLTQLPDDEENEVALTELTEFAWVAAMLVYEERVAARTGSR